MIEPRQKVEANFWRYSFFTKMTDKTTRAMKNLYKVIEIGSITPVSSAETKKELAIRIVAIVR